MNSPKVLSAFLSGCLTAVLALALSSLAPVAHATSFATFQLVTLESGESVSVGNDAYPGKIAFVNRSNQPLCINYQILDDQSNVLRYSKLRVAIPAGRTDLAITGPGDRAQRIYMNVQVGARPPCGASSNLGHFLNITPGQVSGTPWSPVNFDASRWSGKQRDVMVEIK